MREGPREMDTRHGFAACEEMGTREAKMQRIAYDGDPLHVNVLVHEGLDGFETH